MSGYRFQPGDRVIFARPHEHDAEDPGWTEVHVGAGAVGTVLERSKYAYQYRVEYRFGPVVVRQCPLDRQLDPAPTALLRKNTTLLQVALIEAWNLSADAEGMPAYVYQNEETHAFLVLLENDQKRRHDPEGHRLVSVVSADGSVSAE